MDKEAVRSVQMTGGTGPRIEASCLGASRRRAWRSLRFPMGERALRARRAAVPGHAESGSYVSERKGIPEDEKGGRRPHGELVWTICAMQGAPPDQLARSQDAHFEAESAAGRLYSRLRSSSDPPISTAPLHPRYSISNTRTGPGPSPACLLDPHAAHAFSPRSSAR